MNPSQTGNRSSIAKSKRRLVRCVLTIMLSASGLIGPSITPAVAAIPAYDRVRVLPDARPVQDIGLTDQDGKAFRLSDLRGRVVLVFFGFTHCSNVCPLAMQKLQQLAQSAGSELDSTAFVFVSVDPERDTADVLKAYLEPFSSRFIGLTGEPKRLKALAKAFSAAFYKGNASIETGDYVVTHSPQIFVVDSAGRLRAEFYNASTEAMTGVALALRQEAHDSAEKRGGQRAVSDHS